MSFIVFLRKNKSASTLKIKFLLIKTLAPGGGYILSYGHSINPSVKLDNFLPMYEILQR